MLFSRADIKPPWVMYKDGEPLAGLQRIFESSSEEKLAEVIIPCEFMCNTNRRVGRGADRAGGMRFHVQHQQKGGEGGSCESMRVHVQKSGH